MIKICQFWRREFMSLSQKYEKRLRKFLFLAQHHFKAELYRYIFIVIFGKTSVRIILDSINVFLDLQCIVSQEDFQISVFSLNAENTDQKRLRIRTLFTQCNFLFTHLSFNTPIRQYLSLCFLIKCMHEQYFYHFILFCAVKNQHLKSLSLINLDKFLNKWIKNRNNYKLAFFFVVNVTLKRLNLEIYRTVL